MLGKTRLPGDFLELLKTRMGAGYAGLPEKDQRLLAEMAYGIYRGVRDHQTRDGNSFHCRELDSAFGRGGYEVANAAAGFFSRSRNYSKDEGQTKLFTPSKELIRALDEYRELVLERLRLKKVTKILMGGRVVKTLPSAVSSQDKNGVTVPKEVRAGTTSCVPVDAESMRLFLHYLHRTLEDDRAIGVIQKYGDRDAYQMLADRLTSLVDECRTDIAGYGVLAHQYEVCPSGRMYALGSNLQQAPKILKEIALAGCWEYDIENAHYSIVRQMAAKFGYQCKAIDHYLAHKKEVRTELAREAGLTIGEVKTCLVALIYGARASTSPKSAMVKLVGRDRAARLFEISLFVQLKEDVRKARLAILKNHPKTKKGYLVNLAGKSISTSEANTAQQLAHLCQGAEVAALLTAKAILKSRMLLLQHDGWATAERISRVELRKIVEEIEGKTGYLFAIEEEQIRPGEVVENILNDERKKRLH